MKKKPAEKKIARQRPEQRPPMPRVKKRQARWKEIMLAEAQRIADAEGISKVTALRLAGTADVSRATFYNLFPDIGLILDDIYNRAKARK